MEEKEFNKKILQELIKVSKEVFYNSEAKEGTYTAAELANGKDNKGNYIYIQCPNREYVICVDSFKCTFRADSVFRLVWRFEQLTRIQAKGKIRYTKAKESNFTGSFYFTLPKQAKALCKVANNVNGIRTNYDCICVDVDKGYLVATDGATIRANETKISGLSGKPQNTILIHKKDLLGKHAITKGRGSDRTKGIPQPDGVYKTPSVAFIPPETKGKKRFPGVTWRFFFKRGIRIRGSPPHFAKQGNKTI